MGKEIDFIELLSLHNIECQVEKELIILPFLLNNNFY